MMKINIAGLSVDWQSDSTDFVSGFCDCTDSEPVMSLSFVSKLSECYGIQYTDVPVGHFLRQENGEFLCADKDWSAAQVFMYGSSDSEYSLPLAAICSRFSYYSALLLHASLVECKGGGILFVGPSGIGKTTQARLWQEHVGARIINGDKAFVRFIDGTVSAYGLPWKGSSEYCLNEKVPLKAVVVLGQAEENRIKKLSAAQAAELFLPHIFLPHWDKQCLDNALDVFEIILQKVPVLQLECLPDEASVRLLHDTAFN